MSSLFSPKRPKPTPAAPMPDPELAGMSARRAAETAALTRAGRASTILTARPQRDTGAAAPSYNTFSSKTLGT